MDNSGLFTKFFASRAFLIIGIVVLIFLALASSRAYYQNYEIRQEIKNSQEQINKLQDKKLEMLEILKYAKSDAFVEEKARTELNMVKGGENVTVVSSPSVTASRQQSKPVVESKNYSNPRLWWNYFFKH